MVKSILVDDSVHEKIIDLQDIIYKRYRAKMNIQDIVDRLIGNPEESAKRLFEKL